MRKFLSPKILLLAFLTLLALLLPSFFVERLREGFITFFSPTLSQTARVQKESRLENEIKRLELENQLLRTKIKEKESWLAYNVEEKRKAVKASVIYRDAKSYGSFLWVNVGEETNEHLKEKIIQKNSPVVVGRALVGVVDYVGKKSSKVRLITDSEMKPSVQVVRGGITKQLVKEECEALLFLLNHSEKLPCDKKELERKLYDFKETLKTVESTQSLARGFLVGQSDPFWLFHKSHLVGFGFHDEGKNNLSEGDLLQTTGMDGVFPKGLLVAKVTKLTLPKEGNRNFALEAVACVKSLSNLDVVFILPSLQIEEVQ